MSNGKHAQAGGGPQGKADIEAALDRIGKRIKELRTFDVSGIQDRWDGRLDQLQKNVNKAIGDAYGMSSPQYRQHAIPPLDSGLDSTFGDRFTADELRDAVRQALTLA